MVKAAGIPLAITEIIPVPIPDEINALIIYHQAFALMENISKKHPEKFKLLSQTYHTHDNLENSTTAQKQMLSHLILNDPDFIKLFQLTDKAASFPDCRFDIQYERGGDAELPHLAKMKGLSELIGTRTYFLAQEKNYKAAIISAETGFKMGDSLINEPIAISQYVRFAIYTITMNSLQPILNTPVQTIPLQNYRMFLSEIENKKPKLEPIGDITICGGSRSLFQRILNGEINTQGSWFYTGPFWLIKAIGGKFPHEHTGNSNSYSFFKLSVPQTFISYLSKPIIQEDYRFYLNWRRRNLALANMPYYESKDKAVLLYNEIVNPYLCHMISVHFLAYNKNIYSQQARYNADLDTFKLALALKIHKEKHGTYPDSLASLAPGIIPEIPLDPFTGKEYIYRREDKGFMVYSFGPNEKDDNGIYDSKKKRDDISFKVTN